MRNRPVPVLRPLTPGMRWMLFVASGLVFIVGIQLFILPTETDHLFAWTVIPPMSAAFMGGAFWASCALELISARKQTWADARIAVPAVLVFTLLTLRFTIGGFENYHTDINEFPLYTVIFTWIWIIVYTIVPVVLSILLVLQLRVRGAEPSREYPLPLWMRVLLVVQALIFFVVGFLLFFAPDLAIANWPWELSPPENNYIGSWSVGFGIAAAQSAWENDFLRVDAALLSMFIFPVLQGIALLRFVDAIAWDAPQTWFYLVFLFSILIVGVIGTWRARRAAAHAG